MQLPYSDNLNVSCLDRIFDNKSESYKLFWFKSLLTLVQAGKNKIVFSEMVDEMIADAWYMVTEFHLNLGPNDTLEKAVDRLFTISGMKPSEQKEKILEYLKNCEDKELARYRKTLTNMVPYRLQAPFFTAAKADIFSASGNVQIIERINSQTDLIYYFGPLSGMDTEIRISDDWAMYLKKNYEIILGWTEYNMIIYLQRRNPSVPGISDKLSPEKERKLDKVVKYWRLISDISPLREIYYDEPVERGNISIDHFVPWSYVAHDEFWNLHPTTRSINSKKSNHLPSWEKYFDAFAETEYHSYQLMQTEPVIRKEFEKVQKDHLNNAEIRFRLYQDGLSRIEFIQQLESVVSPVYAAAKNCGFSVWEG